MAATNITAVVAQPKTLAPRPFTLLPITFRFLETSMMMIRSGGESRPLMTAVQKSAVMGLMPIASIQTKSSRLHRAARAC